MSKFEARFSDPKVVAEVNGLTRQLGVPAEEAVACSVLQAILERRRKDTADPLMRRAQLTALEDRLKHFRKAYTA
ncbi:MAG: hypothetical protein AAFR00_05045 [Pseudomonadota bacterium]